MAAAPKQTVVLPFLTRPAMSGAGGRSEEEEYTAELWDLAGCVHGLSGLDLSLMNIPVGVASSTPLGSLFLWDADRLTKVSKWRGDSNNQHKLVVAKLARAILSLREVRDAARSIEFTAGGKSFSPNLPIIVEPVFAGKKGTKTLKKSLALLPGGSQGFDSPGASSAHDVPKVLESVPSNLPRLTAATASRPAQPRSDARLVPSLLMSKEMRFQFQTWCAELTGVLKVWSWTAAIAARLFVVLATWIPLLATIVIPIALMCEPSLLWEAAWWFLRLPFRMIASEAARAAASFRHTSHGNVGGQGYPQTDSFCFPTHTSNASFANTGMPQSSSSSVSPPFSAAYAPNPPYAAGGGALMAFGLGLGGGRLSFLPNFPWSH